MKLRNIGASGDYDPISVASTYYYNKSICRQYFIPITLETADNFYWYAEFEGEPSAVEFYCYDTCTKEKKPFIPENYIVGKNTNDVWYVVINGVNESFPCGDLSQIGVKATISTKDWWYWSEVYKIEECGAGVIDCYSGYYNVSDNIKFDIVYSCYGKNDNSGYDANGIYLGKPVVRKFGNSGVRYYHNFPLRNLRVTYSGTKMTYTTLNKRPTKNQLIKTYTISFEAVPYWYEEQFSNAFAKGVVTIDGAQYTISEYSSALIGDPCCERVVVNITAQKTSEANKVITFSCSADECTPPVQDCDFEVGVITDPVYDCTLSGMEITGIDCTLENLIIQ